tara:strand:+ start:426 stop:725 length:300 start_codon:yes stop_codon:yes gene_type:complete
MGINTEIRERNKEIEIDLVEIDGKLQRLIDHLETMKMSQAAVADDIAKIKEALFNPDQGLYARLRELETWKKTQAKLMWMIVSSLMGLLGAAAVTYMNT